MSRAHFSKTLEIRVISGSFGWSLITKQKAESSLRCDALPGAHVTSGLEYAPCLCNTVPALLTRGGSMLIVKWLVKSEI